jgi:hypothetical protein
MKHLRRVRLAAVAAVLATSIVTTGGALLATASPASANVTLPPITVSCSTLSGSIDLNSLTASGTLGHCQIVPIPLFVNAAISISPLDITGGPSPGTITWGTIGKITLQSQISVSAAIGTGDCSAVNPSDLAATLTTTVTGGIGTGLAGTGVICVDTSTTPISFTNATPFTLSGSITI